MLWIATTYAAVGLGLFCYSLYVRGSAIWKTREAVFVGIFWPFVLGLTAYDALRYHLRKQA